MEFYFTYKGKKSKDFGVTARTKSRSLLPETKRYTYDTPLMDGSYDFTEANRFKRPFYKDRVHDMTLRITADGLDELTIKAAKIAAWLTGSGELTFSDAELTIWDARVASDVAYTPERYGKTAELSVMFQSSAVGRASFTTGEGIRLGDAVRLDSDIPLDMSTYFEKQLTHGENPVDFINLGDFSVNISGKLIDISRLSEYGEFMKIELGDRVTVVDGDTKIEERVIRTEVYPYEPLMGEISIGRVKKDLFFYLNQMGKLNRRYGRVSTTGGKVSAKAISGVVSADGINVKDSGGNVTVLTDMIEMSDANGTRFVCGFSGSTFRFGVYDKNGAALYLSDDVMNIRGDISADSLRVNGVSVTGSGGNLYIGDKKILTE